MVATGGVAIGWVTGFKGDVETLLGKTIVFGAAISGVGNLLAEEGR